MTVELDMFSGRPNPSWQLDAAQTRTLMRMLRGVQQSRGRAHPCVTPGLGYRSFALKIVRGTKLSNWRVFDHCVGHEGQAFIDSREGVEAFLLQTVPPGLRTELAGALPRVDR